MIRTEGLKVTTPSDCQIVMTRDFNAPRALVWEAITEPELLKRWFGVFGGWSLSVCEVDLRVGGTAHFVWRAPADSCGPDTPMEMGMRLTYRDVDSPKRLIADEKFDQAWYPGEAESTQLLVEKAGRTTLMHTVVYESRRVRDLVLQTPMEQGVAAGYDALDTLLSTLEAEQVR